MSKKKIPNIPPFHADGKLIFLAELSNQHFTTQCTLVQNTNTLPAFNFKSTNRLKSFEINKSDLLLIIENRNINKTLVFILFFFSKHTVFRYSKLKIQQNDTNTKRYARFKFK